MIDLTTGDERKRFILSTAGNYFQISMPPEEEQDLLKNECLNDFLEDRGCFILSVKTLLNSQLSLENKLPLGEGKETVLVFFKIRPEVVTLERMKELVFVVSMPDSPIVALYHTLQRIFAPTLLKDDRWSQNVEPKLQTMLSDLETNLRIVVLRTQDETITPSASLSEIMSVDDEVHFWNGCANQTKKKSEQEKAKSFLDTLEPLAKSLSQLETMEVGDAEDVVETAYNALDDIWKLDEFRYPQSRMEHLMEIIGKTLTHFIQSKIKSENIWGGDFIEIEAMLTQCITVCSKWVQTCEKLTTLYWPNHSLHRWAGLPYRPVHITRFCDRLKEILNLRTVDRQLTKLLSPNEQAQLNTTSNFKPFSNVAAVQYNPYTEPLWQAAVKRFEEHVRPAEERVAAKLKSQLCNSNLNTLQLMEEFKRYADVVRRPGVARVLVAERESLLSRLQEYVAGARVEPSEQQLRLTDAPPVVARLSWARHLEAKALEIENLSRTILNDLGGYPGLKRALDNLKKELKDYHTEQFDTWTRETGAAIKNRTLGLKTDEPVVHFEQGKLMHVNYNPALVSLVQQVRQISVMGYNVPPHIMDAAELAKQFMKQARALQQVATFHNTIGDRMIASQRPMMLAAAVELARLVREQHNVTWSHTTAVDSYINRLQAVVDRLYKENNQLAHYHNQVTDKVVTLMSTDLLRHQQQWKEGLREIRDLMAHVETQFSNTKSWRVHWDHQIYKALEHQYQLGLEALNQHMPEIRVDIVYRQQRLQFSPPIEEIRMKYYGQLKRFMSIPLSFRGVCDTPIFPAIIDHNAHRFARVYKRAEGLFARLVDVCAEWEDSVALGSLDLDNLCREHLHTANDWDVNFKASKAWSQEIAKLVTSERKIDCFTINVGPVCSEIEQHNRKYWDCLASSLYESIVTDVASVDKFVQEARKTLQIQPQRLDEVGKAHNQYLEIIQRSQQMQGIVEEVQKKNKTLASWTKEKVEQVTSLISSWDNFQIQLNNQQYLISKQVETMKSNLSASVDNVRADVDRFQQCWDQLKPREDSLASSEALRAGLELIRNKRTEWDQLMEAVNTLREEHVQFQMTPPDFPQCEQIEADIKHYEETWALFDSFNTELIEMAKEEWIVFRNKSQLKLLKFVDDWTEKLEKTPTTALTVRLLQELAQYKELAPGLKNLKGESFSEKHWVELFGILKTPFKPVDMLTFGDFLEIRQNIMGNLESLQDLNSRAASEIVIRQALAELDIWEVEAKFSVTSHADCKGQTIQLIKHFNDIMGKVGDHQCLLQSIKSSPNYDNFQDRATLWETRLSDLDNYLRSLNQIQRKWVYLEPILGSGTLKMERGRFERVDRDLRLILSDLAAAGYKVMTLCRIPHLRNTLNMLLQQLTQCQKSLLDYLEEKRLRFPRFYFLGDEDLLEILGQSNKQHVIQSHLKKLFSGIHSVVFRDGLITAMQSLQGETVDLSSPIEVTQDIEEWLNCLSKEMKSTLKKLVRQCLKSPDPARFPSQVLCLAERVSFTSRCEKAIQSNGLKELLSTLKSQLELYTKYQLGSGGTYADDKESAVLELKLKALQLDVIYHMSVVEQLMAAGVAATADWHWQRHLRFYLREDNVVVARMVDAEFVYSYEYQGNASKLVHTPLTDKCYLTLTQAMSMGLGGNPYGPAGTGKTESVKALGGLLGRQVLVFNCDESIDVQSLTRILVGLVKCGAWGCFDEFNRLEEATLSAISMQIHPIQETLRKSSPTVTLLGQEVTVDSNTGIFVTLNPAGQGYAGRQKLPDNLKQLFRPVVMSRPDDTLIAQVTLHCEGFTHANAIGDKLVVLFSLARKLLSQQQHYDWGLRALKTVVGGCGTALREARLNNMSVDSEQSEMALVVRALRLNTLSKLTAADSRAFDQLVQDTFPGAPLETGGDDRLAGAIRQSCQELRLVHNPQQERKCLELYEQLRQRMGVVVVGPSGSGKSTIIKLLKQALTHTGVSVKQHTINAKAMSHTQLLGSIDLDTRQWVDGVLSTTAQADYAQPTDVECWIVFDGDVDPEWIEALNSVLDDNRLLTLPSGWRIQFGPNVHFLFETHDLSHASPATVSRMGMILLSCDDVDSKNLVESWLQTQPEEVVSILTHYVEEYFYKAMSWMLDQGQMAVSTSPAALVSSGLSLMSGVVSRAHFTVALVNGLSCILTETSKQPFCQQVLEWTGEYVAGGPSPDPLRYDSQRDCVDVCVDQGLLESRGCALVATARMSCAAEVLCAWLQQHRSFLLIGPPGSGKSLLLDHCFSKLRNVQVATVHCSAQITPQHILQKLSQLCMVVSSSNGRVYRPSNAERLVLHLKNTNLVHRDKWGSNMLTAWLLQVLTYKGFYDSDLEWVGLENVLFVFSLSSCEGISPRFLAKNLVYNLSSPGRHELKIIYGELIKSILPSNKQNKMATGLANTMVNIYLEVFAKFGSSQQPHYSFTPANITSWCNGLLRYPLTDNQCVIEALLYEAMRLFGDKLVSEKDRATLWAIFSEVMEREFNLRMGADSFRETLFVSESPGRLDGTLLRLPVAECTTLVEKTLNQLGDTSTLVLPELVQMVGRVERVVSSSAGSLVLAGRSGVGRKTAVRVVAARHSATVLTPNITHNYMLATFKNDLKNAMQLAGVEGEQVYFILEDYQLIHTEFLDLINSLLSSGEVPGLYQSEELEATASVLKDAAAQSNFDGNVSQYFASRVKRNFHVVLVLESGDEKFPIYCQNNPALLKSCSILWTDCWSQHTMTMIPRIMISKLKHPTSEDVFSHVEVFKAIHLDCSDISDCSPRRFLSFVQTYLHIYQSRVASIAETQAKLEAGVSKLTAAKQMVDTLKLEAAEQGKLLAEKQAKATAALEMITETMTNANTHRGDMDQLKVQTEKENQLLQIRKKEIEAELAEIQPLIEEARTAVGNIKSEALSEIRSLRAPPEVIRDILEGVLRLMGIQDTSWNSMKTFLAKRGVKEDIRCFDARNINSDNREAVEALLSEHRESFNPKTAKRASQAAAPLAAWVTANVKFSHVLDKIKPLEREQANLHRNLRLAEERINQLSSGLQDVDKTVAELKERLNRFTKEAAELEIHLGRAEETLSSAENLVHKLDLEYNRWRAQLTKLSEALSRLPYHSLLAAAFVNYLSAVPQDLRRRKMAQWCSALEVSQFSVTEFLCSERQQLLWQSQGLSADQLSMENVAIITTVSEASCQSVYVLDPSSAAVAWLRASLREDEAGTEVVSQASPRFHTSLDLAVRFGKKLIIEDADGVEPTVYPVLRGDRGQQDGRKSLRLYHVSRGGTPLTEPHIAALLCQVNYATTEAGLTEQLVQSALRQEKPQLEVRRGELLRREEELKMSLHQLQDTVLQELANAHGDILHNKELLASLNETKRSASAISESLDESARLKAALQAECDVFRGLAEFGSRLYFAVAGLSRLNNMYRLSIAAFLTIFNETVATTTQDEMVWKQILLQKVYLYMARALFKEDTLAFALHLARAMCSSHFQPNEWEVLTGQAVAARGDPTVAVPSWVPQERASAVVYLQSVLPQLSSRLQLESESSWKHFPQSEAPVNLSSFQRVLMVQALRPDLLHTVLTKFAQQALGLSSLSPPPLRLSQLLTETKATEPILILTGAGTDPSQELRQLAQSTNKEYDEVALGEGQETMVAQLLAQLSSQGHWLCLKNLHLMSSWLPTLEHQLASLSPHPEFRLWLTSEPHQKFPPMLVTACLKVTYEAPRGIKRNLVRSYGSWEAQEVSRPQFALAWFHAVVQERRTFIPQGWVKLYEFNDSDLHAALHVLRQRLNKDGRQVKWQYIQGLGESAIYGGRVDNVYDMRVLSAYLRAYFNNSVFLDNAPLAPGVYVPHSSNPQDHKAAIDKLPDQDPPSFFGLPVNVDRSWQRINSAAVIEKLKVVGCEVDSRGKVDQQAWLEHLSPILNLWKKLNQGSGYIKMKVADAGLERSPVATFLWREFQFGVELIQRIHQSLSGVTRVIKGAATATTDLVQLVDSLLLAKTPEAWTAVWVGPTNVTQYLQSATARVAALDSLKDNFAGSIDLSAVFHPDVFFSSLRHQTSRDLRVPVDSLRQQCSWSVVKEPGVTAVHGLQLEGATLSGGSLVTNTAESADVSTVLALYVYWTNKGAQDESNNWIALPLYSSSTRDTVITELKVPSRASEHSKWILAGTAFYIRG